MKTLAVDDGQAVVVVALANAEVVGTVSTSAGACQAQTPAMLKWGASAKLQLRAGDERTFSAGDYTTAVKLIRIDDDHHSGFAF